MHPTTTTVAQTPWANVLDKLYGKGIAKRLYSEPVSDVVNSLLDDHQSLTAPCLLDIAEHSLRDGKEVLFCTVYVVARKLENKVWAFNGRQRYRRYLWEHAIEHKALSMLRFMVEANDRYLVSRTRSHGYTPLAKAVVSNRKAQDDGACVKLVCSLLKPHSSDSSFMAMAMAFDNQGYSPFMHAIRNNREDYVRLFLETFERDDLMAPTGIHCHYARFSPMAIAVVHGATQVVALLLDHGISPTELNPNNSLGLDPLHLAVDMAFQDDALASSYQYMLIVELFMKTGVDLSKPPSDPRHTNYRGNHILHLCARGENMRNCRAARDMMRILLANPTADVNVVSEVSRQTPLMISLKYGNYHVAHDLLSWKCFCLHCGQHHFTPVTRCIDPTCKSHGGNGFRGSVVEPAETKHKNQFGKDAFDLFCLSEASYYSEPYQSTNYAIKPNGFALADEISLKMVLALKGEPISTRKFHKAVKFHEREPLMKMSPWSMKMHALVRDRATAPGAEKNLLAFYLNMRDIVELVLLLVTTAGAPVGRVLRNQKRGSALKLPKELAFEVLQFFSEANFCF